LRFPFENSMMTATISQALLHYHLKSWIKLHFPAWLIHRRFARPRELRGIDQQLTSSSRVINIWKSHGFESRRRLESCQYRGDIPEAQPAGLSALSTTLYIRIPGAEIGRWGNRPVMQKGPVLE
jgi:hypothetical protein